MLKEKISEIIIIMKNELGLSRSAFIIAAYLMRKYHWTVEKALTHIRSCRPNVSPNDGFIKQLTIFYNLKYKADFDSLSHCADYRNWCYSTGHIYQMIPASNGKEPPKNNDTEFVCRKCRKLLFYDDQLLKHYTQEDHDQGSGGKGEGKNECSFGFLLTPMKWMDLSAYEGKVFCPSCHEKLGNYVWGGRVCFGVNGKPCGTAVRPWVQIHKGKVDKKTFNRKDCHPPNTDDKKDGPTVFKPPGTQFTTGTRSEGITMECLSIDEKTDDKYTKCNIQTQKSK
uniref:protein-tyrosine-phosphatase n=1 Tax=Syphacia muris TaxID=451379 RepID=A0A0N5APD7_9BILA